MTNETLPMKHSSKWLLEKILSCGDQHGKALMYIIEFQNALASDGGLADVVRRKEQLLEEQSNWLMANTSLEVEKIVDFKEHFK